MQIRVLLVAAALAAANGPALRPHVAAAAASELSVRITSPLGRSGVPGQIRIVAQVRCPQDLTLQPVRFYVDNVLLGEDQDGPPFAVEWLDENPFEAREIAVEVRDASGRSARDTIRLEPLEVTDSTDISAVVLDVTVHNREGQVVRDLAAADFTVREDGVQQAVEMVRPEQTAATYTLLIDSSQSMARRFEFVRAAAAGLLDHLQPDDRIVVAPFTREVGPVTGPTTDYMTATDAISSLQSQGGTAILNALETVSHRLGGQTGRHAIVLITDGYDEHSTTEREAALTAIKGLNAPLYVIGIGGSAGMSLKGEEFLRRLAADTGGRAFFPTRERELSALHQRLADEVQHRYVIGYTPKNQRIDGTWRRIDVAVGDPSWILRTRSGYFAPRPPPVRPSLEFTVMNASSEFVDVSRDDVVVLEDGVEQQVDTFHEAVSPVSIFMALDSSGSMKKDAAGAQAAARTFVQALRPADRLALMTFADQPFVAHDLTTDRALSLNAIDQYAVKGGTALYDALAGALVRLSHEPGRRVVVVVTDGRDENNPGTGPGSTKSLAHVVSLIKQHDITVFAIGLGAGADARVLEQLAAESGGDAYFPRDVSTLEQHYARIVENLRRRYLISYPSTNAQRDGGWHSVEIRCRVPGTRLRFKGGYVAPER